MLTVDAVVAHKRGDDVCRTFAGDVKVALNLLVGCPLSATILPLSARAASGDAAPAYSASGLGRLAGLAAASVDSADVIEGGARCFVFEVGVTRRHFRS